MGFGYPNEVQNSEEKIPKNSFYTDEWLLSKKIKTKICLSNLNNQKGWI